MRVMRTPVAYLMLALLLAASLPLNASADETQDIPTNAAATGIHDTLVDAVVQADLLATLQGAGPFTLFAPSDQAFADAGVDLVALDTPEGKVALQDILLHHVFSGEVPASAVTDGMLANMVNGDNLKFGVSNGLVTVGNANVTLADVQASNGIIHVIDGVATPKPPLIGQNGGYVAGTVPGSGEGRTGLDTKVYTK